MGESFELNVVEKIYNKILEEQYAEHRFFKDAKVSNVFLESDTFNPCRKVEMTSDS